MTSDAQTQSVIPTLDILPFLDEHLCFAEVTSIYTCSHSQLLHSHVGSESLSFLLKLNLQEHIKIVINCDFF